MEKHVTRRISGVPMTPEIIGTFTDDPREVGKQYTIKHGTGVKETRLIIRVKQITDGSILDGGFSEVSQVVRRTEAPDPCSLSCSVCDEPIASREWDWAAMQENGPVHVGCFMTADALRAKLDEVNELCDELIFCDGVNNCRIVRAADGGLHLIY